MISTEMFHINAARVRRGEGPRHIKPVAEVESARCGPQYLTATSKGAYRVSECYPTRARACEVGRALIEAERVALKEAYAAALDRLNNATFACEPPV